MSTTISFKIRTIKGQIEACLRAIKNGLRSFVDRLCVLEAQLEAIMTTQAEPQVEPKYIELTSNRSKGINAYLVKEGLDYRENDYGTPIGEENQQRAYRSKSHVVKVRIETWQTVYTVSLKRLGNMLTRLKKGG